MEQSKHKLLLEAEKQSQSDSQDEDNDCWADANEEQFTVNNSNDTNLSPPQQISLSISPGYLHKEGLNLNHHHQADSKQPSTSSAYSSIRSDDVNITGTNSHNDKIPENGNLVLHKAIFNDDALKVSQILRDEELAKQLINKKDKHGNTPLHLACMLGRSKEMVNCLLQMGAVVDSKNLNRWTPFHEACSYGNRDIIVLMTQRLKDEVYDALNKNKFSENLAKTRNYRLVLKWEFQSWVPFLTRVLPSDVCVINKQGKYIRIDTRLLDFDTLPWKRGDSCLIYSPNFERKWIVLNNKAKKYQHFEPQNMDRDIEDKVDDFMATDIMDFDLKSSDIQLTRSTCGWIWKADRVERIGRYNAALYNFNNVYLVTQKRREHLNVEDLKRNKLAYKAAVHILKFGQKPNLKDLDESAANNGDDSTEDSSDQPSQDQVDDEIVHRESLPPPPPRVVTWADYYNAEPGKFPVLGREPVCKVVKRAFKASVAMSEEFPITKNEFLDLLSIIPLKHFKKMKEFIEGRLPDGFPVRLDVPIFPFLTARITFEDFAFIDGPIDEQMFSIPDDYEEDPNLLNRLTGKLKGGSGTRS